MVNRITKGFALPSIMIASVVMLIVLVTTVSAVATTRTVLHDQYYNMLAKQAAESGIAMAEACINTGTTTWANPLRPNGNCAGSASQCTNSDNCWVLKNDQVRTTFEVSSPSDDMFESKATVQLLRKSNGAVWKSYEQNVKRLEQGEKQPLVWKQVASSYYHTCAIGSDDKVYCWGYNNYGQLGDNSTVNRTTPKAVAQGAIPAGATIKKIAVGNYHSCAIASNNKAYCWGYNAYRQLGNSVAGNSSIPVEVQQGAMPAGSTIREISTRYYHTCVIASDNKTYCWGYNYYGQVGNGTSGSATVTSPTAVSQGAMPAGAMVRELSAGLYHTCVIASDDKAYCWGYNTDGELGDNTTTQRTTPVAVQQGAMPAGAMVRQITTGYYHTCVIASDNRSYCWGQNTKGQLGDNTTTQRSLPVAVQQGAMSSTDVRQISTGYYHTCVVGSDNKTYCWGQNGYGQLGDNTTTQRNIPVAVQQGAMSSTDVRQVSAGYNHTCAIGSDNKTYCWGYNTFGQLGDGTTTLQLIPININFLEDYSDRPVADMGVSSFGGATCSLASNNWVYCWGVNTSGQLGNGTTTATSNIVPISRGAIPADATIRQLSVGKTHACVLASNNWVYCWGNNSGGVLGDGTTTARTTPVTVSRGAIPTTATIVKISVGSLHTCAIASNNQAYCWGQNTDGYLGNGGTTSSSIPVAVSQGARPAGSTVRDIATGEGWACIIASNNLPYCWGYNAVGSVGDGTTVRKLTPVAVLQGARPAGTTARDLMAGYYHACIIASNNLPYCWGQGYIGHLGNNSNSNIAQPVAVVMTGALSGKTVVQMAAAGHTTCAIASDSLPYCWGYNQYGQVGNNSLSDTWVPAAVSVSGASGLTGKTVYSITVGERHACAAASDNSTYCWGLNDLRQLNDGTTTNRSIPVATSQLPAYPVTAYRKILF